MFHTPGDNLEPLDSISKIMCGTSNIANATNCVDERSCMLNSGIRLGLGSLSLNPSSVAAVKLPAVLDLAVSRERMTRMTR